MFFRTSTRNDIVSVFHLQKSCLSGIHFFLTLPMKSLLKFSIRGREGKGREGNSVGDGGKHLTIQYAASTMMGSLHTLFQ